MSYRLRGTYFESCNCDDADDGRRHSVRIGDAVDIEVEDFAAAEEGKVMTLNGIGHPAGPTLAMGLGVRSRIQAFGLEVDNTGKKAPSAPFAWQAGGVGCARPGRRAGGPDVDAHAAS